MTQQFQPRQLHALIAPRRTLGFVALALGVVVLMGAMVFAAQDAVRIAAVRWLSPWNHVEWPKHTDVTQLSWTCAHPADLPLRLRGRAQRVSPEHARAGVLSPDRQSRRGRPLAESPPERTSRGDNLACRHFSANRLCVGDAGFANIIQNACRRHPTAHPYQRLVEVNDQAPSANAAGVRGYVEYYFQAADDQTEPTRVALVDRPEVTAVRVTLTPPAYARALLDPHTTDLYATSNQTPTARALAGSTARLDIQFNKPLPITAQQVHQLAPGLPADQVTLLPSTSTTDDGKKNNAASTSRSEGLTRHVALTFPVRQTMQTPIVLEDTFGFTNLSERRYMIEATPDELPEVSILQPDSDQAVLPKAQVSVEALVRDDVGAEAVALEAEMPSAAKSNADQTTAVLHLAQHTGEQQQLNVSHTLDLAAYTLNPGDTVTLTAVGRDIYELDGQRHQPVRSSPRRLRIIDTATFTSQLRSELAGIRQQAIRLDSDQAQLADRAPAQAQPRQQRLTQRLEAQQTLVQRLLDRAKRNRLEAPALTKMMQQARHLLNHAQQASDEAQQKLDNAAADPAKAEPAKQQAHKKQQAVRTALNDLVSLLDQGQDALQLQLALRELRTTQRNIETETRELLPQTVGEAVEDLPKDLRDKLKDLIKRQKEAAAQSEKLVRDMQAAAGAMAQQDDSDRSRATAESLAEAANLAEREGLSQQMNQSSKSIEENRLSSAGQSQSESLDLLQRMLREMGKQDQRMQAMLRRRLQQLAQLLEQLIDQQNQQLAALKNAGQLPPLARGQSEVRRRTMGAVEMARGSDSTAAAADPIDAAVQAQGNAIQGLRQSEHAAAQNAEQSAVARLNEALDQIRKQRDKLQRKTARDERAKLQEAYEKLAKQQDGLHAEVANVVKAGDAQALSRRQRAELVKLGHAQEDLRLAAGKLGEQVQQALLFQHLHDRVDEAAREAVTHLRRALADEAVLRDQQRVADDLRRMAAVAQATAAGLRLRRSAPGRRGRRRWRRWPEAAVGAAGGAIEAAALVAGGHA